MPRRASSRKWANRGFAALCAAVPTWRSAFPCVRAILSRRGACRDGRHPGSGRTAVSLRFAQRCRPGGRRSRACAPSFPVGVRVETCVIQEVGEPRFRCALRSGADLEVGVPVPARHPFPRGCVPRRASSRKWANRGFAALCPAVPTGGLYPSDFVFWALRCERHRRALLHQPVSRPAGSNQPEVCVSNTYAGLCLDGSWP